LNIAKTNL